MSYSRITDRAARRIIESVHVTERLTRLPQGALRHLPVPVPIPDLRVKNVSGAARAAFDILGLGAAVYNPSTQTDQFKAGAVLAGELPNTADHLGRFAVLQHAAAANEIAAAVASGVCLCKVYCQTAADESLQYADIDDGTVSQLKAAESGSARILWRASGTGAQWAVVRIGGGGGSGTAIRRATLSSALLYNATTAQVTIADDSGGPYSALNYFEESGPEDAKCFVIPNDDAETKAASPWILLRVRPTTITVVDDEDYDTASGSWRKSTRQIGATTRGDSTGLEAYVTCGDPSNDLQRDSTSVAGTLSPSSSTWGDSGVTFSAAVSHSEGTNTPVGQVQLYVGNQILATYTLGGSSVAVTGIPVGTTALRVAYLGDSYYNGSESTVSCTITAAATSTSLTVTPASPTYGDELVLTAAVTSSAGTVTGGYVQIKDGSTVIGQYPTGFTLRVRTLDAGSHTFTAEYHGGGGNFADSTSSGVAKTIAKRQLTVTADNKTRVYGDANPSFTVTMTGFVNEDTQASDVTGTPAYTCSAVAGSNVGSYTITPAVGTLAATNYTFAYQAGSLSVTAAPLVVTADNKSKSQGQPNPALTGSLSGVKNSDDLTLSCTTPCTTDSPAGSYVITPNATGAAIGNYTKTIHTATLTVT